MATKYKTVPVLISLESIADLMGIEKNSAFTNVKKKGIEHSAVQYTGHRPANMYDVRDLVAAGLLTFSINAAATKESQKRGKPAKQKRGWKNE